MANAIIGLGHTKTGPKTFYDDLDYDEIYDERNIGLSLTLSGPNSIYDDKVFGPWPVKIWAEFT